MPTAPKPDPESRSRRQPFKICLVSLYSSSAIGLRYLTAVLRKNGFDVHLIFFKEKNIALDLMELPTQKEHDLLLRAIADIQPDLIGVSVRSSFLSIAREITRGIRGRLARPVIWGGTHATVAPEESLETADFICLGEGEQAFLELASELSAGRSGDLVQNIWHRRNGEIVRNPIRPFIESLDSLPFPYFGDDGCLAIQDDQVSLRDPGLLAFNLDVMTSRGCPYRCSYCSNSIFHSLYRGKGRPVRLRTVRNVIEEIKAQRELFPRLKRVDFIDEVFSWNKPWVEEFVETYKAEIGLPFHCMQHPTTTDREVMQLLKDAGLERVEIGVQSGSERIRREIFERQVSDDELIQTSRVMRDLKITPFYDIIVDNPFETADDKRQGLDLLVKMSRPFYMHMFSLIYFPGTNLTRRALDSGLITRDQVEGSSTKSFDQMYVSLKHPRAPEDRFWISLFSLTSKRFVPKRLILALSRSTYLRKNPAPLVAFAGICNTMKLAAIAAKWLREGKPVFSSLGRRKKSGKRGNRIV